MVYISKEELLYRLSFKVVIVSLLNWLQKGKDTKMAWPFLCTYLRGRSGNGTPDYE